MGKDQVMGGEMRIIIAGGGTGGHLFPGIAIAEELSTRNPANEVLFVGTARGLEARVLPERNIPLRTLSAKGVKGKSLLHKAAAFAAMPGGVMEALHIIRDFKPNLVIGLGAYVSGPMLVAAFLRGIPRVIQEQNILPGATNRILARLAHRAFISFEESHRYFPPTKAVMTGNPIRREFIGFVDSEKRSGACLLVFGGSRGAHHINEAMVDALDLLEELRPRMKVIHQTGRDDFSRIVETYRRRGFEARVEPFIDDMVTQYRAANLVICRAGATTLAEVTACGRASILVPYPFAVNNHQEINARALVKKGAARMILDSELSGTTLAGAIRSLFSNSSEIEAMERASASLAKPHAARRIVDECYRLVGHMA